MYTAVIVALQNIADKVLVCQNEASALPAMLVLSAFTAELCFALCCFQQLVFSSFSISFSWGADGQHKGIINVFTTEKPY